MSDPVGVVKDERTYSLAEVAEGLGIPTYRLRSWENFYPVFKASRSENGQPQYSESDITVIQRIAELLYKEGRKSHEIMPILREELGHITTDSKFNAAEKAQLTEDLAKENEQLRHDVAELREKINNLEQHQCAVQTELSETISILGQENAKLQSELQYLQNVKADLGKAEEEIQRLTSDLKVAEEVHINDEELLAHYKKFETENEHLREEVQALVLHKDSKRAAHQDKEIDRLRTGIEAVLIELGRLKKVFIS